VRQTRGGRCLELLLRRGTERFEISWRHHASGVVVISVGARMIGALLALQHDGGKGIKSARLLERFGGRSVVVGFVWACNLL